MGAHRLRPDKLMGRWRVVVGQLATLKADHNVNCRNAVPNGCLEIGAGTLGLLPERPFLFLT